MKQKYRDETEHKLEWEIKHLFFLHDELLWLVCYIMAARQMDIVNIRMWPFSEEFNEFYIG